MTALWHCVSKSPQTGGDLADPRRCCRNGPWQCDCVFPHKLGISNDMGLTRGWLIQGNTQTRPSGDSKNSCHRRLAVTALWHCVSKCPQTGWDLAGPRRCCRNGPWQCDCVFPHKLGISNDMGLTREWLVQGNTQTWRSGDSKNSCHRRLAVTALWHCVSKCPQTGWDLADPRHCCRNGPWQCDCVFPDKLGK